MSDAPRQRHRGIDLLEERLRRARRRPRRIGLGFLAGALLAWSGATAVLRDAFLLVVTPPEALVTSPALLFSSYLAQSVVLAVITFRAYARERDFIAAAGWVLATWEAIASILRRDLLLTKFLYPGIYDLTVFMHILTVVALFVALGAGASRARDEAEQTRRLLRTNPPIRRSDIE